MYVTAHRVRSSSGQEGINAFVHEHGERVWPEEAWRMPEEDPGRLVKKAISIKPGGNRVIAFLDLLAPDGCRRSELDTVLRAVWLELVAAEAVPDSLMGSIPNPLFFTSGMISLRFGLNENMETGRSMQFSELWQALSDVLEQSHWKA